MRTRRNTVGIYSVAPSFFSNATVLGCASSIGGSKPSESAPAGAAARPLPAVEPNIAAASGVMPRAIFHGDAGAVLGEELHDRVVAERRRDVQRGVAGLVRGIHVAAQADRGGDGLAHAAFRFDLAEIDGLDAAAARVWLDPMPAASMTASRRSACVSARIGAAGHERRMMSGSRNLAASRYGVEPISVAGRLKSVVSRRIGVPFVDPDVRIGAVREQRLHQRQIASAGPPRAARCSRCRRRSGSAPFSSSSARDAARGRCGPRAPAR